MPRNTPLTLDNLDQLNAIGDKGGSDIHLTYHVNISLGPEWLEGSTIDESGDTQGDRTGVIVTVEKGNGVVDVFYFYFWAFAVGGVVLKEQLGEWLQKTEMKSC